MSQNEPGELTPQEVMHQIVIPALSAAMHKGKEGVRITRLDYVSDPVPHVTWVEVTTDAGDHVRLALDPMPPLTDYTISNRRPRSLGVELGEGVD